MTTNERPSYRKAIEVYSLNLAESCYLDECDSTHVSLIADIWNKRPEDVAMDVVRMREANGFDVHCVPPRNGGALLTYRCRHHEPRSY